MTNDFIDPEERDLPLEPRMAEAARAYHPPPATPREAMWARIAAARAEAGAATRTALVAAEPAPDARVISIDAARARRRPMRTWALLAGTLAAGIAFGVFGGDLLRQRAETGHVVATTPDRARATTDSGANATSDAAPSQSAQVAAAAADPGSSGSGTRPPKPGTTGVVLPQRGTGREGTQQVAVTPRAPRGGPPPNDNIRRSPSTGITPRARPEATLYHTAAVQTLSQAEALLVAWRVDAPRDTVAARQLGTWARDVLGSTRLLLDSPAAADPRLRSLLDDLELVLAQIVQLSGAPLTAEERRLLEGSVRARDLLPRIRSAVPAGQSGSATII